MGEEAINQCAFIYVLPAGRNVIVVSPGANATLDPETAMLKLRGLGEGDFLLAQLETPMETVEAALAYAKCRGATTVLDPALKRLAAAVDAYLTRRAGVAALRAVLKLHCVADPESFLKLKRRESIALRAAFPAVVQGPIYSWLGPYWLDGEQWMNGLNISETRTFVAFVIRAWEENWSCPRIKETEPASAQFRFRDFGLHEALASSVRGRVAGWQKSCVFRQWA